MLQWNHPLRALCQYSVTLLRWPTSLAALTGRGVCIIEFGLGFHAVTKKNNPPPKKKARKYMAQGRTYSENNDQQNQKACVPF